MFTGIVTQKGIVEQVESASGGSRLTISGDFAGVSVGDSISVAGVCLTATRVTAAVMTVDVVPETLRRSTLGGLRSGDSVNLETSLRADGFVGGHFVQGHVDAVGVVAAVVREGAEARITIEVPDGLERYVVEKGSIALEGVSLTVASVEGSTFEVALIPHTLAETTLAELAVGDTLNVEVDMIAKYVERLLAGRASDPPLDLESE